MGSFQNHALGRETVMAAASESAFAAFVAIAGADAFRVLKSELKYELNMVDAIDSSLSRSLQQRFQGKAVSGWSIESYARGNGAAATPHDYALLLQKAFGNQAIAANVAYTFLSAQTALGSFRLSKSNSAVVRQDMSGCAIDKFTASAEGGNEPHLKWEGIGSRLIHTGASLVDGANILDTATSGSSDGPYTAEPDSIVQIGTSTGAGAGHRILTIDRANGNITFSPGVSGQQNIGVSILPFHPTPVLSSQNPINGVTGSLTIDAVGVVPIVGWEFTLENNLKPVDDESFQQHITDYTMGKRRVTGSVSVRARQDMVTYYGRWKNDPSFLRAIAWTCGSVAGNRINFSIPFAQIDNAMFEIPDVEEAIIKIPWVATASAAGEDEATLTTD